MPLASPGMVVGFVAAWVDCGSERWFGRGPAGIGRSAHARRDAPARDLWINCAFVKSSAKPSGSLEKMSRSKMETVENVVAPMVEAAVAKGWIDRREGLVERLSEFARELRKWNRTFNLTSVVEPAEVAELHFLDSLAIAPWVPEGARMLDVGAGAGFPGLPLALARDDVEVSLVDRTEKKVAFMKNAIARLGIANARALHVRLEGQPDEEGLEGPFDVVVSRAFTAPEAWLPFAAPYAREGGTVIAMLGSKGPEVEELVEQLGLEPESLRRIDYRLPSGARRALLLWTRGPIRAGN